MKKHLSEYTTLIQEWDYELNKDLDPTKLTYGSNKKAWWICPKCGNEYQATIAHRTAKNKPTGCPSCGHKKGAQSYSFAINMYDLNTNELIKTFNSIAEACKIMHLSHTTISQVCKGQRKQAGGYYWEFRNKSQQQ